MDKSASVVSALADIFVDPKKVFRAADGQKGWTLLPLFLIVAIPLAVQAYYFSTVDISWFVDHIATASGKEIPEEARKFMTRGTMMASTLVGQLIMIPLILAIYGLYLHLIAKTATSDQRPYGAWFRLSVWSAMPVLISALATLIYYVASGTTQMGPEELSFFSANALITHYPMGHKAATFMQSITPFLFWNIALAAVGLQVWTQRTFMKSLLVAAVPYIGVFGIWAIVAFG